MALSIEAVAAIEYNLKEKEIEGWEVDKGRGE